MKKIAIAAAMLFLTTPCFAQESQRPKPDAQKPPAVPSPPSQVEPKEVTVEVPPFSFESLPRRPLPTITLQRALKFAEAYLKDQNVKLSMLYLVAARYDVLVTGDDEMPWWIFRWETKNRQGNDVELYVSMRGIVWNPPTM